MSYYRAICLFVLRQMDDIHVLYITVPTCRVVQQLLPAIVPPTYVYTHCYVCTYVVIPINLHTYMSILNMNMKLPDLGLEGMYLGFHILIIAQAN